MNPRTQITRYPTPAMKVEYMSGIRVKGFDLNSVNGTQDAQLSLSGLGKELLGFVVKGTESELDQITLSIRVNNDVLIEKVRASGLAKSTANPRQFFEFYRPLTGQDTIIASFKAGAAYNFEIEVYYTQQQDL